MYMYVFRYACIYDREHQVNDTNDLLNYMEILKKKSMR